ncbi:MAG: hypothetical protein HY324_01405, partial [Chlamydiia bacterium]|nr:hypothetical protein [Chlamydiia bacterium]
AASPPTSPPSFTVTPTSALSQLAQDENYVINGQPGQLYPGGMVNCQAEAQSFQQNCSDQSQTQQMSLQMVMTEVQQEWTVVSTAIQILNQCYMTPASAIYSG